MTEPTDAEILELASQYWHCLDETESATEIELVRAALAKWGRPAQAAEPVAWAHASMGDWGYKISEKVLKITRHAQPQHGFVTPLYLAPQPVAREPLTPEQIATAGEIEDNDSAFLAGFSTGARFAEQHHGIKGGQHGAD